ncbi:tetratricopeptide repeat protein [Capnocytophaga canimorsus]|nr:tetratricopeptide repeat protein [Capnocytophaga canimorsus]WGU69837.1 tetratricopeptide repeat protein [Capnocytophaga canimorsus]VEJ19599.1 photosystem I assembly protein Ycf3 [Capnocytophaga canimorsus]
MNIFYEAFRRERTTNIKVRELSKILLNGNLPEYLIHYQKAIDDYYNQNYQEALVNINKTIAISDIDDWRHFAFKANVLEDLGRYNEAIENYTKAIDYAGDDIRIYAQYHQVGFCYMSLNNHKKAIEFYTFAIELKKKHPNSPLNEDLEGMDMGVMLGVEFKRMYNNRGNSLKNIGRLQDAFEDCKKALEYDANYSNPYLLLSQIFSQAGQEDKALIFLKKSANLGNQNAQRMLRQLGYF